MIENITEAFLKGEKEITVQENIEPHEITKICEHISIGNWRCCYFWISEYRVNVNTTRLTFEEGTLEESQEIVEFVQRIDRSLDNLAQKYIEVVNASNGTTEENGAVINLNDERTLAKAVNILFNLNNVDSRVEKCTYFDETIHAVISSTSEADKLTLPYYDSPLSKPLIPRTTMHYEIGEYANHLMEAEYLLFETEKPQFQGKSYSEDQFPVITPKSIIEIAYSPNMCVFLTEPVMKKLDEYLKRLPIFVTRYGLLHEEHYHVTNLKYKNNILLMKGETSAAVVVRSDNLEQVVEEYCQKQDEDINIITPIRNKIAIYDIVSEYQERYNKTAVIQYFMVNGPYKGRNPKYTSINGSTEICRETPNAYRWHYHTLNENEQEIIDIIVKAALRLQKEVCISTRRKLTKDRISTLQKVIRYDFPELFYVTIVDSTSVEGYISRFTILRDNCSEAPAWQEKLFEKAHKLLAEWGPDFSDLHIEFQRYIDKNVVYEKPTEESDSILQREYTALGCLLDGKCVCQGFSLAFILLSDLCRQKAISVGGLGHGEPHAWNKLELDGIWYNADFTWNLNTSTYIHMCCPDDLFPEHENDADFDYPCCTDIKQYYYATRGLYVETRGSSASDVEERISAILSRQLAAGGTEATVNAKGFDFVQYCAEQLQRVIKTLPALSRNGLEHQSTIHQNEILRVEVTARQ